MTPEEILYTSIGQSIKTAEQSQMFGKPCFKIGGKAFVCFFQNCMVFKLHGDAQTQALSCKDSQLFDPSGKGRAMKEWVQIPYTHKEKWSTFASEAAEYVKQ